MGGSDNKGDSLASQPRRYRVPGQPGWGFPTRVRILFFKYSLGSEADG